jgi:hypothetical protein
VLTKFVNKGYFMSKGIYLGLALTLLTGTAHASEYVGVIAADGLRFSTGNSPARVSIAVSKPTACGTTWYSYENATSGINGLWTAALIQASVHGLTIRISGNGTCDSFGVEGVRHIDLR